MNEEEEAAARAELLTAQLAAAKADRTIKLNDFTGDNVPFINWMQHVNMSIAAAAWSQETSATRVQLALKGRAGVWFQNQLVLGVEGLDVWYPPEMGGVRPPNLLTLMEQRFHKAMSPLEQCNLRSTLTQKENEDSQKIFDRVLYNLICPPSLCRLKLSVRERGKMFSNTLDQNKGRRFY